MTEPEADAEAQRLNFEVGRAGVVDTFYVARELESGEWTVEEVRRPKGLLRTALEGLNPLDLLS